MSYVGVPTIILYLALAAWTIAYDTIYALQDVEDDALVGVKSTARLFGDKAVLGAFSFHLIAAALAGFATWTVGAGRMGALTMMAFLAHGAWQSLQLRKGRTENALAMFKSNVWAGGILVAGLMLAAIIGGDRASTKQSAWDVIIDPANIEMEKIRLREAMPGWMRDQDSTEMPDDELTWQRLSDLITENRNRPADDTEEAESLLPEWMRRDRAE